MKDYSLPIYSEYRNWMMKRRNKGISWEELEYACKKDKNGLQAFLQAQRDLNDWNIDLEDWKNIWEQQRIDEERRIEISIGGGAAQINDKEADNYIDRVPDEDHSAWKLYKDHLLSNGFTDDAVSEIERATYRIIKRLSDDTTDIPPRKGLVIGNVQSGKTANMAALMAMAADWGWNFFIVLSGTIENLRKQTQSRLYSDLNQPGGGLTWQNLEHLSVNSEIGNRLQDLNISSNSNMRYLTVCLKISKRLEDMLQWLKKDDNKRKQMKILLIDDEADQAGINTANIDKDEETKVSALIRKLVHCKLGKMKEPDKDKLTVPLYKAMNYIGYTATPYANVLNDARPESLYPRNFVSALAVSNEYFGPQQIFGVETGKYDGLKIVRGIDKDDIDVIKKIHDGDEDELPKSMKESVAWFVCAVACMRMWNYKKPISMLIHTSQKTDYHKNIARAVKKWIQSDDVERKCKEVWERETKEFTLKRFRDGYPDYGRSDSEINDYPAYKDIKGEIRKLLDNKVTNIPLDADGVPQYHKGIHLSVDNCKNNKLTPEGWRVRLIYPDSDNMPALAPAFIVVGGATLSRGLTIEGLVSTYFLRSVGQADTLMQMGRWFGYRKGYELLPRIWITEKTEKQFKFLSELDQDLRDELHDWDVLNIHPEDYGPKVKNTPQLSFIRITAKNRMQMAKTTEYDFTGSYNQTFMFQNDEKILRKNLELTTSFIDALGMPAPTKEINKKHTTGSHVWRGVNFSKIERFLHEYSFCNSMAVFNNLDAVCEWINKMTADGNLDDWNVILSGNGGKGKTFGDEYKEFKNVSVYKVTRSRKTGGDKSIINIGALRNPMDIVADVDLEGKSETYISRFNKCKSSDVKAMRTGANMDSVPQLIIYIIDGKSKNTSGSTDRMNLELKTDIAGICLNIPGNLRGNGKNYATKLSIPIEGGIFDDEGDI